jgi:uncharacterized protein YecT (DUF1311 family)
MENIIGELIYIEQQAAARWDRLSLEKAGLPARIESEIERRTAEVNQKTNIAIRTITQESKQEADEKINKIYNDYRQEADEMETRFSKNHEAWRDRIFSCVLRG